VRLRLPFGQELLLVAGSAVRRLDRTTAEVVARRWLDAHEAEARTLAGATAEDGDRERVVGRLVDRLVAGELLVVEMEEELRASHVPPPAPAPRLSELVDPAPIRPPPAPEKEDEPVLLRLELGALGFPPLGVLTLPRADGARRHPWNALVTVLKVLRDRPGCGLVVAGHTEANEPADHSRLRAEALVAFLVDDRSGWLAIASKWGRVVDTQRFLAALANEEGWPITPADPTDEADDATASAVLEFQRGVNARRPKNEAIHEDGIIGEQTLGAIYDVARATFLGWLDANRVGTDALAWFRANQPTLACAARFKPYRTMPPLPAHHGGRFVDLIVVPPEAAAKVDLGRAPEGAGVYEAADIRTIVFGGVVPPRVGLGLEIALRDDRDTPMAGADFEVVDPTGRVHRGTLDDHGEARLDGLPAGMCRIAFPGLQPGRWFLEGTTPL